MSVFLIGVLIGVAVLIVLGLYGVYNGLMVFDWLVAVVLVFVNGVVVLVVLGFVFEWLSFFFDIALGYLLFVFFFLIAFGKYFECRVEEFG